MKARLFIRGMREPVELERHEALSAQLLISDNSRDPRTPFSIEGVVATKKEDMKFVVFDQPEKSTAYEFDSEPMAQGEALLFEQEIPAYKAEASAQGSKEVYWREFYLQNKGAVRLEFYETAERRHFQILILNPDLYTSLNRRLQSYQKWKLRKQFVEERRAEELQVLADEIKEI